MHTPAAGKLANGCDMKWFICMSVLYRINFSSQNQKVAKFTRVLGLVQALMAAEKLRSILGSGEFGKRDLTLDAPVRGLLLL